MISPQVDEGTPSKRRKRNLIVVGKEGRDSPDHLWHFI
jgi:hypothetical protein